jgi:hypothetical protein
MLLSYKDLLITLREETLNLKDNKTNKYILWTYTCLLSNKSGGEDRYQCI